MIEKEEWEGGGGEEPTPPFLSSTVNQYLKIKFFNFEMGF
jgi:hypothetical protein